jgi:hemoglobin
MSEASAEARWFEALGGEAGIARLVERFYASMDAREDARAIRAMHPADLADSRDKLWMFLVGRFGGRPLYVQARGHPRLRARHLPFPIGPEEASQWTRCMDDALAACVNDPQVVVELRAFFATIAAHMQNR